MPVTGADTIAKNIKTFGDGFLKHVNKTMKKVSKVIDKEVTKNMSLQDHSLKDLARLGHSYAAKHGPTGLPIHDPYWLVHKQSGQLLRSKERGVTEANIAFGRLKAAAWVKLDENVAPHAEYIVYGTSKMIPRPFLLMSFNRRTNEIVAILKKNLRDMVINFRGI